VPTKRAKMGRCERDSRTTLSTKKTSDIKDISSKAPKASREKGGVSFVVGDALSTRREMVGHESLRCSLFLIIGRGRWLRIVYAKIPQSEGRERIDVPRKSTSRGKVP